MNSGNQRTAAKRCTNDALGFMSVLYTFFMKIASLRFTSGSQEVGDDQNLSADKRIYIESSAIRELFYSHGGLCRDKEMLADRFVRERFFFAEKMR